MDRLLLKMMQNDMNATSARSNFIAELSLRTMWQVAQHVERDNGSIVLHMICTQLRPGHLSVHVENSLRCSEETVKNLKLRL